MPRPQPIRDSILLSTASAYAICDTLLKISNCVITELPEAELRDVRYTVNALSERVNQLLDSAECDVSLHFDGLSINHGRSYGPCLSSPHHILPS